MKSGAESRKVGSAVQWAVALALGSSIPVSPPARAATAAELEASVNFDIAAQPLDTALLEFSKQAGVQVLATESAVSGKTTQGVRGAYPVSRALAELLRGSGLKYRQTAERAVTIDLQNGRQAAGTDGSFNLAQSGQEGNGSADIEEVVVRGIEFRYTAPSTATKLPMAPKDIPQSITLVTEDVMDFASIRRFDDIYRVDASSGSTFRNDGFPTAFFRGFTNQGVNAIRIDGFRFAGNIDLDMLGFERFEVVKGPSSALFGQNTIGGTLNAVTKKPQAARAGSLRVLGGNDDFRRGELDLTGPIDAQGRWKYRLIGAFEDTGSYLDFAGRKSTTVVPSLSFDMSERTRFLLTGYYNKQKAVSDWGAGLQAVDAAAGDFRLLPVSRSHFFGEPWNHTDLEASIVTLQMEHDFNDSWRIRMAVQRNKLQKDRLNCSAQNNADLEGRVFPGCFTYLSEEDTPLHSGEVNLIGDFEAFGQKHTVLFGADYAEQDSYRMQAFDYIDDADHGTAWGSSIGYNVLNPVRIAPVSREDFPFYRQRLNDATYSGLTAQLLLHATDRLSLLMAARYNKDRRTRADQRSSDTLAGLGEVDYVSRPVAVFDSSKTVGQAGITYELTPSTNLYFNWGQTYEPQLGLQFDPSNPDGGMHIAPEQGEQFEVGIKGGALDDRLGLTLAIFSMERSGISQSDHEHPGFNTPIGTQRSRGVELGAAGQLLPGWEIYASAAFMDAEFIEGEFVGMHAANAPKQALSVFTSYQLQGGPAKGLGVGLGYVYKNGLENYGQVFGHDPVHFDFGDVNELDLRVFYNTPRWEAFVSARNLLEDTYYAPSFFNDFRWGISVNPGRSIVAGLTYKLF